MTGELIGPAMAAFMVMASSYCLFRMLREQDRALASARSVKAPRQRR